MVTSTTLTLANGAATSSDSAETGQGAAPLWGKSAGLAEPYPLLSHLLDTSGAARAILEVVLPPSLLSMIGELAGTAAGEWKQAVSVLAGWHDIGKATCGFQNLDRSACPQWAVGHSDAPDAGHHAMIGAHLAWDKLQGRAARDKSRAVQIIGGHHGIVPALNAHELDAWGGAGMVDRNPPAELIAARSALWEILDGTVGELPDLPMPTPAASMALAIVVLADWTASSASFITAQQEYPPAERDPAEHMDRARKIAVSFLGDAGLACPPARKRLAPDELFGVPDGKAKWTPLQADLDERFSPSGPGIAVICAPTGEGKTEAALIAAEKFGIASGRPGLFFAMPTIATAEGLHERLSHWLHASSLGDQHTDIRRVHSQSLLYEEQGGGSVSQDRTAAGVAAQWMAGTRKALLAPFGVGTIDQVLLGALRAKHSPLRMLGAAMGTLVVDEAHSLDPYMQKLLCRAIEWLGTLGTPVIILSATLPPAQASELFRAYQSGVGRKASAERDDRLLAGYPAWAAWTAADGWTSGQAEPRNTWQLNISIQTCQQPELDTEIARRAVAASRPTGCVLVVRSTVADAQATYRAIKQADPTLDPGYSVDIIHSRMAHGTRRERTGRLLDLFGPNPADRPERMILVSTQVVEQSFDTDFDILITDPAPLPALLQRAGRVRRHRQSEPGEFRRVEVLWPTAVDGSPNTSSPIYSQADLMGAHACITQADTADEITINVPEDVPELIAQADIESEARFQFAEDTAEEAAEATLVQLVRIDVDRSFATKWAICPPRPDEPLTELTGSLDTDETHPGTRHQADSVLVIPTEPVAGGWKLPTVGLLDAKPALLPATADVRAVFDEAISVSYPNHSWAKALPSLGGAWDRTPVAGGLLLDPTAGEAGIGGYRLTTDQEVGMEIRRTR